MYVKRVLPNGVRIISERLDNVRTVSVGIWVGNGSRYEPAELNGISHFIEHMIFKGTEKRSARHIAIAIDALGGQANAFTDKECTCYYMKVLDSRLQTGISLLADMFLESRFAQEDIELERGVVLEEIDMYEDSPEDVAIDKLFEKCYDGSALAAPSSARRRRSRPSRPRSCTNTCTSITARRTRSSRSPAISLTRILTISQTCSRS